MTQLTNLENRMVIDAYWHTFGVPPDEEYDPSDDFDDYIFPLTDEDEQDEPSK